MTNNSFTNVYGGSAVQPAMPSYAAYALTANLALSWPGFANNNNANVAASTMNISTSIASLTFTLPPATQVSPGVSLIINNVGNETILIYTNDGSELTPIAVTVSLILTLTDNTTIAGIWTIEVLGATTAEANANSLAGAGLDVLNGTLNVATFVVNPITGTYIMGTSDRDLLLVAGGSGGYTWTLPLVDSATDGYQVFLKNNSSAGQLTIIPNPAEPGGDVTIDGASSLVMNPNDSCSVVTDGVNWFTVGLGVQSYNFDSIDNPNVGGSSDYTLTATQAAKNIQIFTGTLTGNINVIFPAITKVYVLNNATSGAYTLSMKSPSGTATVLTQGELYSAYLDGTNFYFYPTVPLGSITFDAGTAEDPSIHFVDDGNTGLYSPGAGLLGIAATSTAIANFSIQGMQFVGAGTAAAPLIYSSSNSTSGFYFAAANTPAVTVNGAEQLYINGTGAYFANVLNSGNGTAAAPAYSFTNEYSTGMFFDTTSSGIGFSYAGTEQMFIGASQINFYNVQLFQSDGTVTAPSYSFASSTNTGMYYNTGDSLGFSVQGSFQLGLYTTYMGLVVPIHGSNGSASAPAYSFTNETNTGMYYTGTSLAFSYGAVEQLAIGTTDVATAVPIYAPNGSASAPAYSFTNTISSGMYATGSGIVLSYGGVSQVAVQSTGVYINNIFANTSGTSSAPAIAFATSTGTGLYLGGSTLGFSYAGTSVLIMNATAIEPEVPIEGANGTVTAPAYSFASSTNTGMYYTGTSLAFSYGAVEQLAIGTTDVATAVPIYAPNGSTSTPLYSFSASTTSGMYYNPTATALCFTSAGTTFLESSSSATTLALPTAFSNGLTVSAGDLTFVSGADTIKIAAPTSAPTITYTLPASSPTSVNSYLTSNTSGTLAWGPGSVGSVNTFRATMSGTLTGALTPTIIPFNTITFDTGGWYNATSYRYTPQQAGYYLICASTDIDLTASTTLQPQLLLYKNGALYSKLTTNMISAQNINWLGIQDIILLNGSTDYISIYYDDDGTGLSSIPFSGAWFSGFLVLAT